jgi:hypothetical protein
MLVSSRNEDIGRIDPRIVRAGINEALNAGSISFGASDGSGKAPERLEWLSLNESKAMVKHWIDDLRAEKYGHLALLTPESGAMRGNASPGSIPSWLAKDADRVFILFQDYVKIGIAYCSWAFVLSNMAKMALIDGNGFAAVTDELAGVLLVDPEDGDAVLAFSIEAWGSLVAAG